jgi:dipeptidyl aminopeptidase/acylaminoacyl peptidase
MTKQFRLSAFVFALCIGCGASGALAAENGSIVDQVIYRFPPYEQAMQQTDVERYADKAAYDEAVADTRFELVKLKYVSDDLKVVAYLYRPKQSEGLKFPAIVFNRGSVVRGDIAPELIAFFHRLASAGFVILAPMLRQSDGGEGRDEVGGADVADLMNTVPLAKSLGFVDMDNLFMYGESRGGMMTYLAVQRGFPMRAAAVFGAFTDFDELVTSHPNQYPLQVLKQIWPDYEAQRNEISRSRSALQWADQLKVPLLIMHGGADQGVSPEQSLNLAQKLQKLARTYELIIYAGDNHILTQNQQDRDRRALAWFNRYRKN